MSSHALMPLLDHAIDHQSKPGVSARVLYSFLQLNPAAWARWAKKNIVMNPYAMEYVDWERLQLDVENTIEPSVGGRPTQDFVVSIDFAKRLCMMARSTKGEEARQYFLDCEKAVQEQPRLPQLHNPMNQVMIDMVLRVDALDYEIAQQKKENERLSAGLTKADAKADMALESQRFFTIAEYVYFNNLRPQVPESAYKACSDHLRLYCLDNGIPFRKILVGGKRWEDEYGFHEDVYATAFPGWLKRRYAQTNLIALRKD